MIFTKWFPPSHNCQHICMVYYADAVDFKLASQLDIAVVDVAVTTFR